MKNNYDVIVVGAGPAGSSTAEVCAKNGLDVLILERNPEIGVPKRCAEGLSDNAVKRLQLNIPKDCIAQTIEGDIVYAPNGKKVEIRFEKTSGYVLERKRFDKWLASNAEKAGAEIIRKAMVYDLIKDNGFVTGVKANINGKDTDIKSKVVVAADGAESMIAREAGLKTNKALNLVDSGFQYEMDNIDLENPHMIEIYVGTKIAHRGYVWIFPKGEKRANVGIGIRPEERTAKSYLDEFISKRECLKKGRILEVNGGSVPVGGLMKNMVTNGLVTVGDAANQVNPLHGGGIAEAITAGRIAGSVIKNAFDNNDFSSKSLSEYNKIWWNERGKKLKKVEKIREAFENMDDNNMNDLAEVLSGEDLIGLSKGKNLSKFAKILVKYKMKGLARKIGF
jgi:digeranylgeranylglycerophospholipid reductase